jgi:hypothetical protein
MKRLVVIALLISVMAGAIFAQAVPGGLESPQSAATQGRFRSAADDFIRPDSYTSAKVNNWFAMTSYGTNNMAQLGFATKISSLYLAAYYGGNFWNMNGYDYFEVKDTWVDGQDKNITAYDNIPALSAATNRFALLFGVADMGFRLTFASTYRSFSESEFFVITGGPTAYKSYDAATGALSPQLAWSMSKDLTEKKGIKPYLTFGVNFNKNYTKSEAYLMDGTTDTAGLRVYNSANNLEIPVTAGLGGFNFYNEDGFKGVLDLDYVLTIRNYDNEYSYQDGTGKYRTSNFSGLNTNGNLTENSYTQNEITPSIAGSWSKENLGLKFKLNLPVTIRNESSTAFKVKDNTGALWKDGDSSETFYFGFSPNLRLAAQWKVASRLTINAGGRLTVNALGSTTVDNKVYVTDDEDKDSAYTRVTKVFGATSNQLTAGVTLNATDNLTFEASCGIGTGTGANNISIFKDDGALNFTSLLVSLKF